MGTASIKGYKRADEMTEGFMTKPRHFFFASEVWTVAGRGVRSHAPTA
jgi:hypothetical protein